MAPAGIGARIGRPGPDRASMWRCRRCCDVQGGSASRSGFSRSGGPGPRAAGAGETSPDPVHPRPTAATAEDPAPTGPECTTTPSTTQPGYSVADPRCVFTGAAYTGARFTPLTDAAGRPLSRVLTGIVRGAAYRIEVPLRWNGQLVALLARLPRHRHDRVRGQPALRRTPVERGFAWAASSYATNGYDVAQGVRDSHALIALFRGKVRTAAARCT